ncbi:hypothetical protein NLG97_g8744 [Lecanicillium saksenae]|uniref:Uncharacterized protein n=1 Tax=Lecanicillium saksenae TaxID=468837 RepID=A0ACC1QJF5_9HYPO|nr:hypothetical protein NLG97_g8744 [Lecanicillium saksenae]
MDVQQVNSRVIHEEPDTVYQLEAEGPAPAAAQQGGDGGQVERQITALSSASFEETYPEGGWAAWLVVLGAFFALFSAMGLMNSIAIFQAYTLDHQLKGYSEGTVGWIYSIYTFLAFFGGVYFGPIFDKYGPRWLTISGAVCVTCAMVAMSFCTQLWHFILSFGILGGLGTSLIFTPCIAAVGHWFKARRGFATGIATCAGGLGGIIFPLMLTDLFDRIGYGWATRVVALICLVCSCIGILLVRSRLPPAQNATAHPDPRIFRQVPFTLATVGIFLLEFSLFIPLAYISTYAIHKGFSQAFAYHLIPIMNAGSVNLFLAIHEISHNLAFKNATANRLLAIFANLPIGIPYSASFRPYHLTHHKSLGVDGLDTDLPTALEAFFLDSIFGKAFFCTFQIFFYAIRPMTVYRIPLTGVHALNIAVQVAFDAALVHFASPKAVLYLVLSSFLAGSLHPVAGHFIAEHYVYETVTPAQRDPANKVPVPETFSYYGPLNWVTYNVGLHNEHHDFPAIPWTRLHKVNRIASEFYDDLPRHESWVYAIWRFIWDPSVGMNCRVKRQNGGRLVGGAVSWKENEIQA